MGVVISRIWGPSQHFEADSVTGLKAGEKSLLTDNFNVLKQDMSKSGARLFILYFQDYPDYKNYFRDFKGKNISELEGSAKLIAHGTNVMCALNGIMMHLNEPETLVEVIKKIGYSHGRRNITLQALMDLKISLLKLLKEKLGNKYTPAVEDVWSKTMDIIAATFESGVQEFIKDKNRD